MFKICAFKINLVISLFLKKTIIPLINVVMTDRYYEMTELPSTPRPLIFLVIQ